MVGRDILFSRLASRSNLLLIITSFAILLGCDRDPSSYNINDTNSDSSHVSKLVFIAVDNEGRHNLFTINDDGSDLKQIFTNESAIGDVRVSPDRMRIVFYAYENNNQNSELFSCKLDGSEVKQLTQNTGFPYEPQWFASGEGIIFENLRGPAQICFIRSDGTGFKQLTSRDTTSHRFPNLAPNDKHIVFEERLENSKIWIMNSDGTDEKCISDQVSDDYWPIWSYDASKILYRNENSGNLYVMNKDGTGKKLLTNMRCGVPHSSPIDGKIVFAANSGIYKMNLDGSGLELILNCLANAYPVLWSPDGNKIAFIGDINKDGNTSICVTNSNGTSVREITTLNMKVHFYYANRQFDWIN